MYETRTVSLERVCPDAHTKSKTLAILWMQDVRTAKAQGKWYCYNMTANWAPPDLHLYRANMKVSSQTACASDQVLPAY